MNNDEIRSFIKGKRIAGIDYGLKRVGFAVCDELHITTSPRKFYINDDTFLSKLINDLKFENACACVVGVPITYDGNKTKFQEIIESFIEELKLKSHLPVFTYDESYSSKQAVGKMVESGKRKTARSRKGETDKVAAALILRDFLNEMEY